MDKRTTRGHLFLFFTATLAVSAAMGVNDGVFNNFLRDSFKSMDALGRGGLEFPRELPGFLVVVMAGLLYRLPVTRLGVVGAVLFALGLVGLAIFGRSFYLMVIMMTLASSGAHMLMPVTSSIALATCDPARRGWRLSQVRVCQTIGILFGGGIIWLLFESLGCGYRTCFLWGAFIAGSGGIVYSLMHIPELKKPRPRLTFDSKYKLYYVLELLFGARKQVFLTFGSWVLVKEYGRPAQEIAALLVIASIIGLAFKPLIGLLIDSMGERFVLMLDGIVLALICLCYGYAQYMLSGKGPLYIVMCCYVADSLMFSLGMARSTYVSRITSSHHELSSTLAMGVSMNHIASMVLPFLAGIVWINYGYETVFLIAGCIALLTTVIAHRIPSHLRASSV